MVESLINLLKAGGKGKHAGGNLNQFSSPGDYIIEIPKELVGVPRGQDKASLVLLANPVDDS